jgi:hypothetical protein
MSSRYFCVNPDNMYMISVNIVNNLLMKTQLILALLSILIACDQLVPIQKNGYGFTVGDPNGKLQIEAFFDFQCRIGSK